MADVVSKAVRSRMMAGITGKDTQPELLIRRGLHRRGFRFRLHAKDLPGRPDIVLPKYGAVLFINGCFWHGHDCALFKWPSSNRQFWRDKIHANRERDKRKRRELMRAGWWVGTVWECVLKGPGRRDFGVVLDAIEYWLKYDERHRDFRGRRGRR